MRFLTLLLDFIFPPKRDAVIVRDLSEDALLLHLNPRPLSLLGHAGAALMPYRTRPIGALVREAKFGANVRAQRLLALALSEYLNDYLADRTAYEERPVALVPVPLSKKRYRERGYNQVEEVLRRLPGDRLIHARALKRTRDTRPQTRLAKKERQKNLEGAFASPALDPLYLYIVVDDVATTGATLTEAVHALQIGGARHIVPIALSY
jgi:ComF family protein